MHFLQRGQVSTIKPPRQPEEELTATHAPIMIWDHYSAPDAFGISRFQVLCCRELTSVYRELEFLEHESPDVHLSADMQSNDINISVFRGSVEISTPETKLAFHGRNFESPEKLILTMQIALSNAV